MPHVSPVALGAVGPIDRLAGQVAADRIASPRSADSLVSDRVELSEHARRIDRLRQLPDVRLDRIAEVRREIAAGTYETDARLEQAITQLIDDLRD